MPTRGIITYNHFRTWNIFFWLLLLSTSFSAAQSVVHFKYTPVSAPTASFSHISNNLQALFTDQSSGQIVAWAWTFGDGNIDSVANPVHTYDSSGMYQVCLVITDSYGCRDTFCDTLDIILNQKQAMEAEDLQLFPNPASEYCHLQMIIPSKMQVRICLYRLHGQRVYFLEETCSPGKRLFRIPLAKAMLPRGLYVLSVQTPDLQHSFQLTLNPEAP